MNFFRTEFIRLMVAIPLAVIIEFLNPSIGIAEGGLQSLYDPSRGLRIINVGDSEVVVKYIRFNNRMECDVLPFDVNSIGFKIMQIFEDPETQTKLINYGIIPTILKLRFAKEDGYSNAFLSYTMVDNIGIDHLDSVTLQVGESLLVLEAGECKTIVRAEVNADIGAFLFEFDSPIQF